MTGPAPTSPKRRRLFVAAWPPAEVARAVAALERPDPPAVRWTSPEAWHVTLRFLGGVAPDAVPSVAGALQALRAVPPVVAELGPATRRLGRSVLVAPVAGLEGVAAAVDEALAGVGIAPEGRPFRGHLTVARARGRASLPRDLAGGPLAARWVVDEVTLVESTLRGARGSRYSVLERVPLAGADHP